MDGNRSNKSWRARPLSESMSPDSGGRRVARGARPCHPQPLRFPRCRLPAAPEAERSTGSPGMAMRVESDGELQHTPTAGVVLSVFGSLPPTARARIARNTHSAAVLVLMLVHAFPYAGGSVFSDTARDLNAAWGIVEGARPLLGPVINDTFHLGPAWFYLLAAPMALSESVSITLVVVGLLAALKFPFAYAVGRQLLDARLGLLFAFALALPGWPSMGQVLAMHVVLVEAATLAALYALLRLCRQHAPGWWLAYGLSQSLALHAHPATLLLGMLLPAVVWRRRKAASGREAAWIGVGLLAAALPFLPPLAHEAASGWSGIARLHAYGGEHALLSALLGAPSLLTGVVMGGPLLVWDGLHGGTGAALIASLHVLLLSAAAAGWICSLGSAQARRRLGLAGLASLLVLLGLAALRDRTPWYMASAWQPWYALLLALGWYQLASWRRQVVAVASAASLFLSLATAYMWIAAGAAGVITLRPHLLRNVQAVSDQGRSSFVPAWLLDRLGGRLCQAKSPIVLHGDVAFAYDSALALPGRMQCNALHRVGIGGGSRLTGVDHLLGLAPWMLAALGADGSVSWSAALRLRPLGVIAGSGSIPVALGDRTPFRTRQGGPRIRHSIRFDAPAGAVVIVNRPFYAYDRVEVLSAYADGVLEEPVHERAALIALRCGHCARTQATWELELENGNPDWIDVFLFDPTRSRLDGAFDDPELIRHTISK